MRAEKKEINIQIGKRLQNAKVCLQHALEKIASIHRKPLQRRWMYKHYSKLESGVYGLPPRKLLVLYEMHKIEPTCLITRERTRSFDFEGFLANCSRMKAKSMKHRKSKAVGCKWDSGQASLT